MGMPEQRHLSGIQRIKKVYDRLKKGQATQEDKEVVRRLYREKIRSPKA